jgi:hypothetical protein
VDRWDFFTLLFTPFFSRQFARDGARGDGRYFVARIVADIRAADEPPKLSRRASETGCAMQQRPAQSVGASSVRALVSPAIRVGGGDDNMQSMNVCARFSPYLNASCSERKWNCSGKLASSWLGQPGEETVHDTR